MTVVKHGSVHYSFMIFGKMFQILVVGSDDSECSFLVETFQYSFGNSTSDLRLRTSTGAHPQIREIATPLLRELQQIIPICFDDILPKEADHETS